jgi:hypothetical protein
MKLKDLSPAQAPPDFAAQTASQIALAARLEADQAHPPPNFAAQVSSQIALDATTNPLMTLENVQTPTNFAARVSSQIALDANPLSKLHPVATPPDFAARVAQRIAEETVLVFEPIHAPKSFATRVSSRIAQDAAQNAEHDRTPLYFLGTLLAGVALAFGALTWRDAQAAGVALFTVLRSLPESLVLPVALVALFAVVATLSPKTTRLPAGVAAFGVAAAFVVPQLSGWFGNTRIEGAGQLASVVRFAGDITVASEVRGDVIAIGGNVRLETGARVSGRVLTFLGDVTVPEGASATAISAVLGNFSGRSLENSQKSYTLPGLSAANALRPVQNLIASNTWQWWYLGLMAALGLGLVWLPQVQRPLGRVWQLEAGKALGLGLLLAFLTVPVVALGGLSVLGTPFAVVLGIFTTLLFSSGAALSLGVLGERTGLSGGWAMLPGLALFAAAMFVPALAVTLWLLLGAWGAGTLLLAMRQGVFVRALG